MPKCRFYILSNSRKEINYVSALTFHISVHDIASHDRPATVIYYKNILL